MRRAVHAEWTKLRTVPAPGWTALAIVALTVGASALTTAVVKCPASCGDDATKLSLTGVLLGQAAVAGLAVLVVTAEYSTGMIVASLAATPRRTVLLAAKAVVMTGVVLAAGVVAVLGSLLAGRLELPGNGFRTADDVLAMSLLHGTTLRAVAGSVLYLALIGLFSLGVAAAVRDPAAAIAVVLGILYVIPVIGDLMLNAAWQHRIDRWTPMDAGLAIQATRDVAHQPIGPWTGLSVLGLWALAALLAGWLVLQLRDA
jgi:ABC-2 type transport system permease protein